MTLTKARKSRATEIDILVSKNLKARRLELGISQSALANLAGISTQQIQKYEKNTNRISSGRLFAFTQYLKVPITYFFEQNKGGKNE
jgi:transcriptional regulator with XRE-family HTH domain